MREIIVGSETRHIECNAYTVYLYSELKGGADLKNVLSAFGHDADDIASLPLNVLLEVFYVMEKTCNPTIQTYQGWLKGLPVEALDMTSGMEGWLIEVIDLITQTFFRQSLKANVVATVRKEGPQEAS